MIKTTLASGVMEVSLGFPPCNEIGTDVVNELEKVLLSIQKRPPQALILHSSLEGGFSAGANLRQLYEEVLRRPPGTAMQELSAFLDQIHRIMNTLDTLPLPTLGVVHGVCFGGGFELALTCDVLVAETTARFCFPELRLGIIPGFGGIPRLRRDLGNSMIRDLLLTGRSINAEKAQQLGFVSQVVKPARGLDVARKMAAQMTRFDAGVASRAKAFIKPLPLEELDKEKKLFLAMFQDPKVLQNLKKFVESKDLRPYLA